jgi:hypothetical protein
LRPKPQGSNAISRYTQLYQQVDAPEPGDLYYMPINPKGVQKDHIGIVYATNEWPANFISIDGNTDGNLGANWALLVKGIGGGYVAKNQCVPKQAYYMPINPKGVQKDHIVGRPFVGRVDDVHILPPTIRRVEGEVSLARYRLNER